MKKKHVIIVGAGPAGLMAAYRLAEYNLKVADLFYITVVDKGNSLDKRYCAVRSNKTCTNCEICNIMCGFGGAGTFSDCKLSLMPSSGVGGDIAEYLGNEVADKYAKEVENILAEFDKYNNKRDIIGKDKTDEYIKIENLLDSVDLNLTYNPTKHIGTDDTFELMGRLYFYLKSLGVCFEFNTEITDIDIETHPTIKVVDGIHKGKNTTCYLADYVILATGRSGNKWMANIMNCLGADVKVNKFDIGYRVELPYNITKDLTDNLYDMKISSIENVDGFDLKVRTFCTNPKGYVSEERYKGVVLANGHSYSNKKSDNTNFALLVTLPFDGTDIVNRYNENTKCRITMQTFTELCNKGKSQSCYIIEPTLKDYVTFKELETEKPHIPDYINKAVIQFLEKLDKIYPGVCSNTTLLYGLEAKFYSDSIRVNNVFECDCNTKNIYCIGDGSGITRGIIQSGCQGLVVADNIIDKTKDGIV